MLSRSGWQDRTADPQEEVNSSPSGKLCAPSPMQLQLVKRNKWNIPGSIELEYAVPEGSDAVKETRKCVEYCRAALTART